MLRSAQLALFLLGIAILTNPVLAQPAPQPDPAPIIDTLNATRTTLGQAPLRRSPTLDAFAESLLATIADDCTFTDESDAVLAAAASVTGEYEIVRECGVNLMPQQVTVAFGERLSAMTGQPLLGEARWNSISIATEVRLSNVGTDQFRYVMVLATLAEDAAPPPPINLTQTLTVDSANMSFLFPEGWVADVGEFDLTIVQNTPDLLPAVDNDPATRPQGPFITLDIFPTDQIGLGNDIRLDALQPALLNVLGVTASDQFDTPVMGHLSRTLTVEDANGAVGLATYWVAGPNLMVFVVTPPNDAALPAWRPIWEDILQSIAPINVLPLSPEPVYVQFMDINLRPPEGWTAFNAVDRYGLFEMEVDRFGFEAGLEQFSGIAVSPLYQNTQELLDGGILAEPTLDALLELNVTFAGLTVPRVSEGYLFGEPALLIKAFRPDNGRWFYGVMGYLDDFVYFMRSTGPSEAAIDSFRPTFHAMMATFARP